MIASGDLLELFMHVINNIAISKIKLLISLLIRIEN